MRHRGSTRGRYCLELQGRSDVAVYCLELQGRSLSFPALPAPADRARVTAAQGFLCVRREADTPADRARVTYSEHVQYGRVRREACRPCTSRGSPEVRPWAS